MSIVVKNDENHDDIMVDLVGVGGWRHTGYLSLCWHQHHFQLTPKNTLTPDCWYQKHKIPDFYTKTHQFSMFWHQANFFLHLHHTWCMWQISGLVKGDCQWQLIFDWIKLIILSQGDFRNVIISWYLIQSKL